MASRTVTCTINGSKKEYVIDVRSSLSDMLRGKGGLDSVKHGCDVGECGACTVLIDGQPFNSCIYLAVWAEGKTILTLEGLSDKKGTISDIQQAFIDEGAVQCGFCTPGFIMASIPIITKEEPASRDEIRKQVAGNLCRCTGYDKIINAIEKTQHKRIEEKMAK
ncbi:MAG: xanthine dehydrogenase subunit XdhC [Sphaerochaetaceae bacterium]|jgi:carbon-monoxide dehydrogenase small subunit|nr:(2Fe-2S)-binding protein [Sphaerochaetaceae bacterium]MDD3367162.1 (2Fe-2S)-binding protein [Sphaerochaetaceae bacterium]MDD4218597.1 (2Fe-2S)-binding protein [Sphaerochaetaceae bacterium]MDY0371531.1 (2Fe-2S)-binding protein [Sphaerochaetaceae bacterium]